MSERSTRLQMKTMRAFVHPNEMTDDMEVIGHIPKLMAQWVTKLLKCTTNSATVIIKGKHVNRGAGYGVELPCEFKFQGHSFSCNWLKDKLKKEKFDLENKIRLTSFFILEYCWMLIIYTCLENYFKLLFTVDCCGNCIRQSVVCLLERLISPLGPLVKCPLPSKRGVCLIGVMIKKTIET